VTVTAGSSAAGETLPRGLSVGLRGHGRTCTLALHGALCEESITALAAQIDQLGCIPFDIVIIDARGIETVDEVGARVLVGLSHYVRGRGGRFVLMGATTTVAAVRREQHRLEVASRSDPNLRRRLNANVNRGRRTAGSPPSRGQEGTRLPVETESYEQAGTDEDERHQCLCALQELEGPSTRESSADVAGKPGHRT